MPIIENTEPQTDCAAPLHPQAVHGLALFNQGEYFEAHEALELAWRAEQTDIRMLYQGILQIAVAYLHIQNGNHKGALILAGRAAEKLKKWPARCRGINVHAARENLALVQAELESLQPEQIQSFNQALFQKVEYET